jgi:hypothetical protein
MASWSKMQLLFFLYCKQATTAKCYPLKPSLSSLWRRNLSISLARAFLQSQCLDNPGRGYVWREKPPWWTCPNNFEYLFHSNMNDLCSVNDSLNNVMRYSIVSLECSLQLDPSWLSNSSWLSFVD